MFIVTFQDSLAQSKPDRKTGGSVGITTGNTMSNNTDHVDKKLIVDNLTIKRNEKK